jgi:hypothetical protein
MNAWFRPHRLAKLRSINQATRTTIVVRVGHFREAGK